MEDWKGTLMTINKMKLVLATTNKGKIKELAKAFIDLPVEILSLEQFGDIPEAIEDGSTFSENALLKAQYYASVTGYPCLADDSGLAVDILDGAPGVHSARYAGVHAGDKKNNAKLVEQLHAHNVNSSTAQFMCSMVIVAPEDHTGIFPMMAEGICKGVVRDIPKGTNGFGYDPYFYLDDGDRTLAEMSPSEKNKISHRGHAIRQIQEQLARYFQANS